MHEAKTRSVFYALDFDRCLADTDALFKLYDEAYQLIVGDVPGSLADERRSAEMRGESFDVLQFVSSHLDEQTQQAVADAFCASAVQRTDVLRPGAQELLKWLKDRRMQYGIMTHGGEAWQRMKLLAAGLSGLPVMIVPRRGQKGRLIASWMHGATFRLPEVFGVGYCGEVVLIDDKPMEFIGLPSKARGYIVRQAAGTELFVHRGAVPDSVRSVDSLTDIIELEPAY